MDAEQTNESSAMRPVRRTDKLIVREVGDELVAYALDTEQVTALDPVTATVWQRLDGRSDLAEIAKASELSGPEVEDAVLRLDQAGLIAGGVDRRKFMRLAAAGVGAGALLAITAPAAMAAYSGRTLTVTGTCGVNGTNRTIAGLVSGTGYPPGPGSITIQINVHFTNGTPPPADLNQDLSVTPDANGAFTDKAWSFGKDNTGIYNNKSFTVTATSVITNAPTRIAVNSGSCAS